MTREELDRMADWLSTEADKVEREEPHAINTISALREAADYVNAADADDDGAYTGT